MHKNRSSSFVWAATLKLSLQLGPTNKHLLGGRHQVVKGVWWPEGFAVINNVVCCFIFFPAYARGCLSQPPLTHVRAETSNSSSEPVYGYPGITGEVGARWKADVWAQAKLGGRCNVLPWVHPSRLISNPEAIWVAAVERTPRLQTLCLEPL